MRATLHDIAHDAGVSHMTVSRALRGMKCVDPATRARVEMCARRLGYRPNSAAKSIVSGRFKCATLLMGTDAVRSNLPNGVLFGVCDRLAESGFQLKISRLPDSMLSDRAQLPSVLTEWSSDGILVDYTHGAPSGMHEVICGCGMPSVWINTAGTADCVRPDDEAMSAEAVEYLTAMGHKRICFLDCSHAEKSLDYAHYSAEHRQRGYTLAMCSSGLSPKVFRPAGDEVLPATRLEAVRAMLAWKPTAVVAYGMHGALERGLYECGVGVPEDISVVTFSESRVWIQGRLCDYVRVPSYEVGRKAADRLLEKIFGNDSPADSVDIKSSGIEKGESSCPPGGKTRLAGIKKSSPGPVRGSGGA